MFFFVFSSFTESVSICKLCICDNFIFVEFTVVLVFFTSLSKVYTIQYNAIVQYTTYHI